LPVDHFTTGLSDEQLRGVVARHRVSFEVAPHHTLGRSREWVRAGWAVDLLGRRSDADGKLHLGDAGRHVHDVLHVIAHAVTTPEPTGVRITLEPYTGSLQYDPRHDFEQMVRLRVLIEPRASGAVEAGGEADGDEPLEPELHDDALAMEEIVARLEALGATRQGS
jgi:hypothetical protein